jgi:hypothetical protein
MYTGSQRLCLLFKYLFEGFVLFPVEYAKDRGLTRQAIYYELKMLRNLGLPVVNSDYGEWLYDKKIPRNDLPKHLSASQKLVLLYIDLLTGKTIAPVEYAKAHGVKPPRIYRQLDLLSQAGIPIVMHKRGAWGLMEREHDTI